MFCRTSGKNRYKSRKQARAALTAARTRRGEGKRENAYYWCAFCEGWHLTSKQTRGTR